MTEPTHRGAHQIEARRSNFLQERKVFGGPFATTDEALAEIARLKEAGEYADCQLRVKLKYERIKKPKGKTA